MRLVRTFFQPGLSNVSLEGATELSRLFHNPENTDLKTKTSRFVTWLNFGIHV